MKTKTRCRIAALFVAAVMAVGFTAACEPGEDRAKTVVDNVFVMVDDFWEWLISRD